MVKFGDKVSSHVQWHLWIQVNNDQGLGQPRWHLHPEGQDTPVDENGERIRPPPGDGTSSNLLKKRNFLNSWSSISLE